MCNKWHSNYVNWFCKFQSLVTIQPLNGELIKKESVEPISFINLKVVANP